LKYVVNRTCIGCGTCISICREVFSMDEGYAVAIDGEVPSEVADSAAEAKASCPVFAIDEVI